MGLVKMERPSAGKNTVQAAAGTTADYAVKETLGIEEKPESRFQKVMEDGTLPHFIPDRR